MPLCTKKQACAAAYILTRNAHIQDHHSRSWTCSVFGPKFKKLGESKNKAKYTHVYVGELVVLTMGEVEVATAAKHCVELLIMLAKIRAVNWKLNILHKYENIMHAV